MWAFCTWRPVKFFSTLKYSPISANKDGDVFGVFAGGLGGVGVDYILVDECGVAVRQRVVHQFVKPFLIREFRI